MADCSSNNVLCESRHTELEPFMKKHPEANTEPLDIEDLVKIGQVQGPCPYFLSREMAGGAELVFMPYQYLIDAKTRIGLDNITWEDAILIFDEAHNLEVGLVWRRLRHAAVLAGTSYPQSVCLCLLRDQKETLCPRLPPGVDLLLLFLQVACTRCEVSAFGAERVCRDSVMRPDSCGAGHIHRGGAARTGGGIGTTGELCGAPGRDCGHGWPRAR